jgi:hypothetical protein
VTGSGGQAERAQPRDRGPSEVYPEDRKPVAASAVREPTATPSGGLSFLEAVLAGCIGSLAIIVLLNLRKVLRWIDGLFEQWPTEPTLVPTDDLGDLGKQTEVLRDLKDQLDAEVEAARATIRRERARAEQRQPGKDMP